jgi:hypothetical protein
LKAARELLAEEEHEKEVARRKLRGKAWKLAVKKAKKAAKKKAFECKKEGVSIAKMTASESDVDDDVSSEGGHHIGAADARLAGDRKDACEPNVVEPSVFNTASSPRPFSLGPSPWLLETLFHVSAAMAHTTRCLGPHHDSPPHQVLQP